MTRPPSRYMAHPANEPPDSARDDMVACAIAIAVLFAIVLLSSWLPFGATWR